MPPTAAKSIPTQGVVDSLDGITLAGWAVDMEGKGQPASLLLVVDDHPLAMFKCSDERPDVNALGFSGKKLGFRFELPADLLDGEKHRLSIRFRGGPALRHLLGDGGFAEEITFQFRQTRVHGIVDGIFGAGVRGWAVRIDNRTGEKSGGVAIEVRANGSKIDQINAERVRNDVGDMFGCEPHVGFLYTLPPRFRDGGPFALEFIAMPEGDALEGSPFSGHALQQDSFDQLHGMYGRIEQLCTQLYAVKHQLRDMLNRDEFTVDTYHYWAPRYFDTLGARMASARGTPEYLALMSGAPAKISVLCPAYRPALADFAAAVESVRRQSYPHWELIIVDDGSKSAALTEVIDDFVRADPRIRAVPHKRNQGISAATNTAIEAATGAWIALFDHDDLLVDVALETMILAARNTGAALLYSDEDKIDRLGRHSEPHLKTDWNYRLLLTNNYVCHLLMADAAALRAAGPFNPAYDGAQDHDLMLRLSETVDPARIHHVPEILYHWRKGENSTASATSAKSYAVDSGLRAVRDHLARRGFQVDIQTPYEATVFDIRWRFDDEPKVSILIPFKDQAEVTRRCLDRLLKTTKYRNFEVVLIDNWSTEPETTKFVASAARDPRVRVVRIEEKFNFARINNLAARSLDSDLLLFMNNDIFVEQNDWLRLMVNEVLAEPSVGAVGVKLVYPNQTVQHAGVVLGVGGVADHTFRYAARDERGYCFRASVASEMSAVTAACMLCRADAFREAGMFDEDRLAVAFNDVDLCLKLGAAGWRVIYLPAVVAEHHESLSRGNDMAENHIGRFYDENQTMMDRWGALIGCDPFYNPHFSHETGMYEKLSSASLEVSRAPSLLHRPVPRARRESFPPLSIQKRVAHPPATPVASVARRVAEAVTAVPLKSSPPKKPAGKTGKPTGRARAAAPPAD